MSRTSGDRCGGRRSPWAAVVLLAVLLAGCGGDADDGGAADAAPTTAAPTADGAAEEPGSSTTTTASPTTTTASTTLPDASVVVPIDEDLVARLPQLEGGGRRVSDDEAFDERFCDGTKAPSVPKGQARATYPLSSTDELTVAAYRFPSGGAAAGYLADYATAVRSCAEEAGEPTGLGVPDLFGSAFVLLTERGEAFMALALHDDVMWVLFQLSTAGPVEVDPSTYDGFIRTALG